MKCPKCGNDYPNKIWNIHVPRCQVEEPVIELEEPVIELEEPVIEFINPYKDMSFNQMRAEAKRRKLDVGKNPNKAELEAALVGDDID